MPLNAQAKVVLDMMAAAGFKLEGDPEAVRAMIAAAPRPAGEPVAEVEDRTIPANGTDLPVRIYRPDNSREPKPVLVWFHGGGWVIGTLDGADIGCRLMTNASGCVVVSVDYRLAPENKFPTPVEDCFAATKWVAENAEELNIDASRIAVGGDSAGGNLATVVALLARDAGGPDIHFQALVYPVTNFDFGTISYTENADGYLLTKESMVWFWGHYLQGEGDGESFRASPLRADSLAGLPPALVITAEFDPLRDEGEAYAAALLAAGVEVQHKRYAGQIHGFFANPGIDEGADAARDVGKAIAAALG
jgi:acetyl esterase